MNSKTSRKELVRGARLNLKEAVELFFESASPEEIRGRFHDEIFIIPQSQLPTSEFER